MSFVSNPILLLPVVSATTHTVIPAKAGIQKAPHEA